VVVLDDRKRIIGLNHGAEKLLNISEGEALRASLDSVFGEDVPEVHEALSTGNPQKMMTNSGRFLHLQVTPISPNQALSRTGRVLMFRDVSDVEKAQEEVQSSEQLLRTLIDHSINGVIRMRWVADASGDKFLKCIFANAAAGRFLRTDREDMIGCNAQELVKLVASGMENSEVEMLLRKFIAAAESGEVLDTEAKVALDGGSQWLQVIAESVHENVAVTLVDITDRKAKEQRMESIASSDPLTGVLNRRGFERDAARRLTDSDDLATGALLFIDLNNFKQINDQCGHEIGDQLLIIAAERIRTTLRSCDIIGRPGGDEFVALVPDVGVDVAEKLAKRLTSSLEDPYVIGREKLVCAAATGLAMYPEHANTLTGLLRAADQAMYRAKARSRGAHDVSRPDLLEKAI
jgi:diguanylate cyclase (GGDEF)-like protein